MKFCLLLLGLAIVRGEGRVIVISVDGLRPDAITRLGPELAPNFYRLRAEGAFTDNARTDFDFSVTLPNHACMITGRPVSGPNGHGLKVNSGGFENTVHINGYTPGMFDVAHDHGLATALVAGKSKFAAFAGSYNEVNGAPDLVGVDNGRNKLDHFSIEFTDALSVEVLTAGVRDLSWDLAMLHLRGPDTAGHTSDWNLDPGSAYMMSVRAMDGHLGEIFELLDTTPQLVGTTHLILVTDHGGTPGTYTHVYPEVRTNYTIPFYVWGPGVKEGADLYDLNPGMADPGHSRPRTDAPFQPVRSGMAGNLALQLLGLPAISGSTHNVSQQLRINDPPDFESLYPALSPDGDANGNGLSNYADYVTGADPLGIHRPDLQPRMRGRNIIVNMRYNAADASPGVEMSVDGEFWAPLFEGITFLRQASGETRDGIELTLQVPHFTHRALLRQVMRQAR